MNNGGSFISGQVGPSGEVSVSLGGKDFYSTIQGYEGVVGTTTGDIVTGIDSEQNVGDGGFVIQSNVINQGVLHDESGGTEINPLVGDQGIATIYSGATLDGAKLESGGKIIIESGSTIEGHITFASGGGTLTDFGVHNLSIAGFTNGDEIVLSGTTIPKSKHVTLGSKGVLTIGSIKETFVHGAGMVLNLTSTSSGVEITEKKSSADSSAVSSFKVSPEIVANFRYNPKMNFIGTTLTDEPIGETHLGKTSFAALWGDDFKATDIIGLKGAASSELTLTHPTITAGAQITKLPLQNSILSIATFGLG